MAWYPEYLKMMHVGPLAVVARVVLESVGHINDAFDLGPIPLDGAKVPFNPPLDGNLEGYEPGSLDYFANGRLNTVPSWRERSIIRHCMLFFLLLDECAYLSLVTGRVRLYKFTTSFYALSGRPPLPQFNLGMETQQKEFCIWQSCISKLYTYLF